MSTKIKVNQSHTKKSPVRENETIKKEKFLFRSVPVYIFLLLCIIPACSVAFYIHYFIPEKYMSSSSGIADQNAATVKVVRENELSLVRPILFVDIENDKVLNPVKTKINDYIEQKKQDGSLICASVYLKDFNTGYCFNINPDSLYDPASLVKVPLLMIYLKKAETNPALLKKTYVFKRNRSNTTVKLIKDKSLEDGKSYTVEELLRYMIVYSDNEAYWMLSNYIDGSTLNNLDTKLDIPSNFDITHYPTSEKHIIANVNSVAHYFNVLYNASYLDIPMSVYALDLLTKSTYKDGFVKEIGSDITIAHKFGERTLSYMADGQLKNLQSEFHEFGIVYLKNRPYLLGVMTRGNQSDQLQAMVGNISKIVFDELKAD